MEHKKTCTVEYERKGKRVRQLDIINNPLLF